MEDYIKELKLINMEDVEARVVEWLWYPYIPYEKITIVQGDPGESKTTFALRLAAILSKRGKLQCNDIESMPIDIIGSGAIQLGLNQLESYSSTQF